MCSKELEIAALLGNHLIAEVVPSVNGVLAYTGFFPALKVC